MLHLLANIEDTAKPAQAANDWITTFVPFSLFHLVTVLGCAAAMMASCAYGRRCRAEGEKEERFRRTWGWFILGYQVLITVYYAFPWDWNKSLPLELCDLAAWTAAAAMLTRRRWLRTLLYFWGIGLSTQAFATPIIREGLGTLRYWQFWISHVVIVGSAVYEVVVGRYRPGVKDLCTAAAVTLAYGAVVFVLNLAIGSNYGFVGQSKPDNPTIIDKLGPWPGRVLIMLAIVMSDFVLLWAVWPAARMLARRSGGNAEGAEVAE